MIQNNFFAALKIATIFFITSMTSAYADCQLPLKSKPQQKAIHFFGEALYWHTSETVDWAFTLSLDQSSLRSSYKTFAFEWDPGFRVGIGYTMDHDNWDTQVSYSYFYSKAQDQASGSVTSSFLPARLSLTEPFSQGGASLSVHYNMFDWDLGRSFLASNYLTLRPSIGLRGGWINQAIRSNWINPHFLGLIYISASENLKQHFLGVGPKGGVTGKWQFGNIKNHSFSFLGKFEAGYLWGHWSIRDQFIDNLSTVIDLKTLDRNFGAFMLHSFIGLGWDFSFNQDRSHFALTLGYEIEDWLNQFQIFSDTSGSQSNDLILEGINLGLHFSF